MVCMYGQMPQQSLVQLITTAYLKLKPVTSSLLLLVTCMATPVGYRLLLCLQLVQQVTISHSHSFLVQALIQQAQD